jgi:hypothetical protein
LSAHADVGLVLVVEEAANRRLAVAFDELALVRALRALGQAGGELLAALWEGHHAAMCSARAASR